jgi:hypothetical protein
LRLLLCAVPARRFHPTCKENEMTEIEMKDDVEIEEFTEELSDEALDRDEGKICVVCMMSRN